MGHCWESLQKHLPKPLYLTLGSSYIGLLTGVTEVAITLAAGMVWRRLASDARRKQSGSDWGREQSKRYCSDWR